MPRAVSRRRDKHPADKAAARAKPAGADAASSTDDSFPPPLRPRKRLFAALCGVFVLWLGFLLFLYFTTVYPNRPQSSPAEEHGDGDARGRQRSAVAIIPPPSLPP